MGCVRVLMEHLLVAKNIILSCRWKSRCVLSFVTRGHFSFFPFLFLSSPKNYNLALFCCCYLNPSPFLFLIFLPWSFWKIFIGFQFYLSIQIYDFFFKLVLIVFISIFFLSHFVKVLFVFNVRACISTEN